jgi:hypothetical protein
MTSRFSGITRSDFCLNARGYTENIRGEDEASSEQFKFLRKM